MARHIRDLVDRIDFAEQIRRRAVQEAVSDALAQTWTHRADRLCEAQQRPDDYPGGPVDWETGQPLDPPAPDDERAERLRDSEEACRRKAALLHARHIDAY